jgi:hypothetical protein
MISIKPPECVRDGYRLSENVLRQSSFEYLIRTGFYAKVQRDETFAALATTSAQ